MNLTSEISFGNKLGVAVERRAGKAGDPAPFSPQSKELEEFPEQKKCDSDEGDPEEGVDLGGGVVSEKARIISGMAGWGGEGSAGRLT